MVKNEKKVKYISIADFREFGFLQEANRQFFHPLGLALEICLDTEGNETLAKIWDYRDDPEGIIFDECDIEKAKRVAELGGRMADSRLKALGFIIQPLGAMRRK